jgi:ELWxxDGT repeat protein
MNAQSYSFEALTSMENEGFDYANGLFEFKGKLYFEATKSTGIYLCTVDTDNKTKSLIELHSTDHGNLSEYKLKKAVAGGHIFFLKRNGLKTELWQTSDGENFQKIADPFDGLKGSNIDNFYATNDYLYYTATTEDNGMELFSCKTSDLTTECLHIIAGNMPTNITKPCMYNDKLYFGATDDSHGMELWSYDETNGANMIADHVVGNGDFVPTEFTVFNSKLFFTATTPATGAEVFSYDGANIKLEAEIKDAEEDSSPMYKTVFNDKLYFYAVTNGGTAQLHSLTTDGTVSVIDFEITGSSNVKNMVVFDNHLFGHGNATATGKELFYLNNDVPVMFDIEPKSGFLGIKKSSTPQDLSVANGNLYFIAKVDGNWNIFKLENNNATPVEKLKAKSSFTISPNPATNYFTITSSDNQIEGEVQIFDLSGKLVLKQHVNAGNETINIDKLQSGLYIVSYRNGSQNFTQKLRVK